MKTINPYLGFDGNCQEAMIFYQSCFGGELQFQTVGESPMECPAGTEGQILHSSLGGDNFLIMATDMRPPEGFQSGSEVSLAISFDNEAEVREVFSLLSKEGTIIDDLKETFWGSIFGVVRDKFGKVWMLDFATNQPEEKSQKKTG